MRSINTVCAGALLGALAMGTYTTAAQAEYP